MLTTLNTPALLAEATAVASVPPCWHSSNEERQPGYVQALAERYAH